MSAKIRNQQNREHKDFFQAVSPASHLHQILTGAALDAPPLRRHRTSWPICYDSAIAFKLAAQRQQTPSTVAQQLAVTLTLDCNWQIQVVSPGLIRFECSEVEIAMRLQQLLQVSHHCSSQPLHRRSRAIPSEQLFRVQYVHARCCTLLRSADREGWFTCSNPPPALPWLTATGELRLQQPIEQQTIGLLFDGVDAIANDALTGDRAWKRAVELSHSLDAFQAACRIWGEVKANDLSLAQARLGLTWAGQQLLQVLLMCSSVEAPALL